MAFVDILHTNRKYNVIYADPPWDYNRKGDISKKYGMAAQNYNTLKKEDIQRLPIRDIITENAVCFMWATFPMIQTALETLAAWSFIYKTAAFVWVKKNKKQNTNFWGMGDYTRANAEVCLLGVSKLSKAGVLVKNHGVHQIVESPHRGHSTKPDEVRERIIALLGDVPRIELFARSKCAGWDCWGDDPAIL